MDVLDANAADVRFLQAARHGEVLTPSSWSRPTRRISATGRPSWRPLDEGGSLLEQMAGEFQERHDGDGAATLNDRASTAKRRADEIRRLIIGEPTVD